MANEVRWIAIFSLALLAIVAFFDLATFSDSCKNIVIKGIGGQEMRAVKHCRERNDEAVVTYSTHVKIPLHEVDQDRASYRRTAHEVKVDESESEKRRSRMLFRKRKAKLEFDSKRQIPGGPDAQHHSQNGI